MSKTNKASMPEVVCLNIYDLITQESKTAGLSRDALDVLGMGVFHSGIQVYGEEISFGMDPTGVNDPRTDGIFIVPPMGAMGKFKQQIELGPTNLGPDQIMAILERIRPQFRAASYHMLNHNCNVFTRTFAEAIDPSFPAKFPPWLNRAASTSDKVLPDAAYKSLLAAVAPPTAPPPELVNKIFLPYQGNPPPPLPPSNLSNPKVDVTAGLPVFGMAKAMISNAANTVTSLIGVNEQQEFAKLFPEVPVADLVDNFKVHVLHINRSQSAKLWIAKKGIAFSGSNQLKLIIPLFSVMSLQFGKTVPGAQPALPPTFEPTTDIGNADAILIFLQGGSLIPVFGIGSTAGKALGLVNKISPAQKLLAAIDVEWRQNVRL
jgi:hypothetical protein